jgi:cytochrome P450
LRRSVPALLSNPLETLRKAGEAAGNAVVRVDLGLFRPYLVSRPEHLQHVLRDRADNYVRGGMLWRPLRRLFGDGLGSDGPAWQFRRNLIQPLFSAKYIAAFIDQLAIAVEEGAAALDEYARSGRSVDARVEMTRIIHRALIRVFFGDQIAAPQADRLGHAITSAFVSLNARLLFPFMPDAFPMPGDRTFLRARRDTQDVVTPLVAARSRQAATDAVDPAAGPGAMESSAVAPGGGSGGLDMVSLLCQARDETGAGLDDRQIRDDVVSMFAGASETSAVTLTWLWVALDAHPEVAERLYAEIDRVVGSGPASAAHVSALPYTKMVLHEVMRLYPVAWMIPREAVADDVIDGVRIRAGSTVLASPYLTHRMAEFWPDPEVFDPLRFTPQQADRRHRYAYLPFGAGPHQCLGSHFFMVEAQLIVAALLRRYRPVLQTQVPVTAQPAATLRPRRPVRLRLVPTAPDQSVPQ